MMKIKFSIEEKCFCLNVLLLMKSVISATLFGVVPATALIIINPHNLVVGNQYEELGGGGGVHHCGREGETGDLN